MRGKGERTDLFHSITRDLITKSVPDPFRGWNFDKSVGERIYWEG